MMFDSQALPAQREYSGLEVQRSMLRMNEIHAWGLHCEALRPQLIRICQRILGNPSDAEQCVQDILIKAFEKRNTFVGAPDEAGFRRVLSAWLETTAVRHCLNELRRRRDLPMEDEEYGLFGSDDSLEDDIVQGEYVRHLRQRITQLAREWRPPWDTLDWQIFHARFGLGNPTISEIAQIIGRKESLVRERYYSRIRGVLEQVRDEEVAARSEMPHDPTKESR